MIQTAVFRRTYAQKKIKERLFPAFAVFFVRHIVE